MPELSRRRRLLVLGICCMSLFIVGLDSTIVKVHPDGTGALKKTAHKPSANVVADGAPKFIWLPRVLGAR